MVPVLNIPFLEHVLRRLSGYGISEVVLALSHLAPAIENYFGNGCELKIDIKYAVEPSPLGTAGAVRNALGHIQSATLVMNGDIFTSLNIAAMKEHHATSGAKVTLALTKVDNPCAYGLVETEPDSRVRRFLEKPSPQEVTTNLINAGAYIIEPDVLADIPPDTIVSFERDVFPSLLARSEPVFSFADEGYWIDIGTPAKYHGLNRDLLADSPPKFITHQDHSEVHPTARLEGSVLLGEGCRIGEGVIISGPTVIGPQCCLETGAIVSDAVIWHNVTINAGCNVESSVISDNCTLGPFCHLSECIVGDHVTLPRDYYQTGGQIWPGLA